MKKHSKSNIDLRDLMFQSNQIQIYKVLAVEVEKELDTKHRRFAHAAVITKNVNGQWDKKSMHIIELKHCYNKLSKGPNKTPYEHLPGLILEISHISPGAFFGDLDVVTWSLTSIDIKW